MVSTKIMYFILTTLLISVSTCRRQMPSDYEEFFDLPLPQQVEEFRKYPVSKQLDLYLYDWNYLHPSKVGFAHIIAETGESAVPILISRLKAEKNENSQDAIVHLFEVMFDRGFSKPREDILVEIRKVISDMRDPDTKQLSQERLRKMEKGFRVGGAYILGRVSPEERHRIIEGTNWDIATEAVGGTIPTDGRTPAITFGLPSSFGVSVSHAKRLN